MNKPVKEYYIKFIRQNGQRKSKAWEHFGYLFDVKENKIVEEDKVFCKKCLDKQQNDDNCVIFSCACIQSYSTNCSTGNLIRHLKNEHNLRDIDSENSSGCTKIAKYFDRLAPTKSAKDKKWVLARDLALWMARDLLPFHSISHNGIKDFFKKYKIVADDDEIPASR